MSLCPSFSFLSKAKVGQNCIASCKLPHELKIRIKLENKSAHYCVLAAKKPFKDFKGLGFHTNVSQCEYKELQEVSYLPPLRMCILENPYRYRKYLSVVTEWLFLEFLVFILLHNIRLVVFCDEVLL